LSDPSNNSVVTQPRTVLLHQLSQNDKVYASLKGKVGMKCVYNMET